MKVRFARRTVLAIACVLLLACRQGDGAQGELRVEDAWARATAPGQQTGGVFVTIRGGGSPDRLVGGSTPRARAVEIHSMRMDGDVMRMRRQEAILVPAGKPLDLGPGGTHLMLVGLQAPLRQGETFPLTLRFETAGPKQVKVAVRAIGSSGPRERGDE